MQLRLVYSVEVQSTLKDDHEKSEGVSGIQREQPLFCFDICNKNYDKINNISIYNVVCIT